MNIFSALADPTRRSIIEMLAQQGPLTASEIGEKFPVSAPAISQHLKILREANLVQVEKRGQQRLYHINTQAVREVEDWARQLTQLWSRRFDALERVLEAEMKKLAESERITRMANQSPRELTITRIFDAPRALVFKAWTDPQLLAQWWGPTDFTNPVCEIDVRPGGAILIHMQGPDGSVFPMKGTFLEVVPPEKLVFSSSALEDEQGNPQLEDTTTVTFDELEGGKTRMTMHAVVTKATDLAAGALAGMEEGWNQSLDKLVQLLVKA